MRAIKGKKRLSNSPLDILLTVVLVVENDQDIVDEAVRDIHSVLSETFSYFEILIIDNGSKDYTQLLVKKIQQKIPNIRLLVLSRSYHLEIAFAAALDNSSGDYVVLVDINYDPPRMIPKLIDEAAKGYDIVIAERKDRKEDSLIERVLTGWFYGLLGKILGFEFSTNASYFRVLSRRVVNSVVKIKNKNRYLKYFSAVVGFNHTSVIYQRINRRKLRIKRRGFLKSLIFAFDIIISNSSAPLRLAAIVGVLAGFTNLVFLVYVFVITLVKERVAEGWVTTSVMSATMFFLIFLILTIMSEYIARILNEAKEQPLYFIAEETTSSVLPPENKKINVV